MNEITTQIYQIMHPNGSLASIQLEFDGETVNVKTNVVKPSPPPPPEKVYELTIVCPFCNHQLDEEIYNGTYGCDTGCEYVSIEIECPNCHKVTWSSGAFGEFDNKDEKAEYRADFIEEFVEELRRIAPDRLTDVTDLAKKGSK